MKIYTGEWIFNDFEDKVTGQLECSDDSKWSLLTEVPIKKEVNLEIGKEKREFIRGILLDKRNVTIMDATVKSIGIGFYKGSDAYKTIEYDCRVIIIGPFFEKEEDVSFKKIKISYSYLKEWLNKSYFVIEDIGNLEETFIKLEAKKPKNIIIENKNNNKIEIIYDVKPKIKRDEISIKYNPYIEFTFEDKLNYEEVLNKICEFGQILTILIGKKTYLDKMVRMEDDLLTEVYNSNLEKNYKDIRRDEIVIRYCDIENNLDEIMKNWNKKIDRLKFIVNNLVDLLGRPYTSEYLFIQSVQALESFSKEIRNNQDNFQKKIYYLLKETDFLINIGSKKTISDFAYKIKKTRNYLIHLDDSKQNEDRFNIDDMFYIGKYLSFVLQALVLKELGIKEDVIKNRIMCVNKYIISYVKKLVEEFIR